MRKRMILIVLPVLLLALLGCSRKEVPLMPLETETAGGRLVCSAETEEQAQAIAELYGIELVDYQHGLALYLTEEDPYTVIKRGRDQGWPELSLDHMASAS